MRPSIGRVRPDFIHWRKKDKGDSGPQGAAQERLARWDRPCEPELRNVRFAGPNLTAKGNP